MSQPSKKDDPLLVVAIKFMPEDPGRIQDLLSGRIDVNERDATGWTALHWAAGQASAAVVEVLLEGGADVESPSPEDGETPLHLAAQEGREAAIRVLVACRANVDARNQDGETPLHVAVQHVGGKRDLSFLTTLVGLRADPRALDGEGRDAFASAKLMTNRGDEINTLLRVAAPAPGAGRGRDDAQDRQKAYEEASGGDAHLSAVVKLAAKRGQVDSVKQLLEFQPETAQAIAQAAMISASEAGHVRVLEALMEAGATVSGGPASGGPGTEATTPLIAAAGGEGAMRAVRFLLDARADANAASPDGATPLMAAALGGSSEALKALLAAGADTNATADRGWTALMAGCQAGKAECARMLLDARAFLDARSTDGSTARDLAQNNGHGEIVELLKKREALSARQQKKTSGGGKDVAGNLGTQEDTRDLDSLMAELGEPSGKSASKAAKATAKVATEAAAKAPAKAAAKASASPAHLAEPPPIEPPTPASAPQPQAAAAGQGQDSGSPEAGGGGKARGQAAKASASPAPVASPARIAPPTPASAPQAQAAVAGQGQDSGRPDACGGDGRARGQAAKAGYPDKGKATEVPEEEVAQLRRRLEEIDVARNKLDAEELQVRRRLDKLERPR